MLRLEHFVRHRGAFHTFYTDALGFTEPAARDPALTVNSSEARSGSPIRTSSHFPPTTHRRVTVGDGLEIALEVDGIETFHE